MKRLVGIRGYRREDNIEMDLGEIACTHVNSAEVRIEYTVGAFVNSEMNQKSWCF